MNKILFTGLFVFMQFGLVAQPYDTITLLDCYREAENNFPLMKQLDLYARASDLRLKNLKANYMPTLNINGQLSYQSDVTTVEMNIPPNPYFSSDDISPTPISKDWYKLTFDINQTIYDGGVTSSKNDLETINLHLSQQQVGIELYKLKERINNIYFRILFLQKSRHLLELVGDEISMKLDRVRSAVKNGVLLESDAEILMVEIIHIDQQLVEVNAGITSGIKILKELTMMSVEDETVMIIPELEVSAGPSNNQRPEYKMMTLQQQQIDKLGQLTSTSRMPKLMGFGQLGYGRPGLNMLSNDIEGFYIFGAALSWNVWDWSKNKNEREVLAIQHEVINTNKETFDKNLKTTLIACSEEIQKFKKLIEKDNIIIGLRKNITTRYSSQLDNGVITSTDYLVHVNAEKQARLDREQHIIQLSQAKVNYLTAQGVL
ncbi:MAG: TolC family protein [Bacteroidales bacterium]|nr:TolC family protein [Bacteroidales bacterium]